MGVLSFYKKPQPRGYSEGDFLIEDTSSTSPEYFEITDFPSIVGGGKYLIKLKGNGSNLRLNSQIDVEIIDLHSISHPDHDLIFNSVKKTGRLLIADTSWLQYGVAAEMSRIIVERDPTILKRPMKSLGMQPAPCPTAKALEDLWPQI